MGSLNVPYFVAAPLLIQDLQSWKDQGASPFSNICGRGDGRGDSFSFLHMAATKFMDDLSRIVGTVRDAVAARRCTGYHGIRSFRRLEIPGAGAVKVPSAHPD